jgi:hypothetical protein
MRGKPEADAIERRHEFAWQQGGADPVATQHAALPLRGARRYGPRP